MTFSEQLKADIALIEPALEKYLSRETGEGYDRIFEAAKYSAMAGGKRLRPVIVLEFCRLCGEMCIRDRCKAVGVAVVVRITAALCRDAGQSALAAKMEIAGAVLTLSVCLPLFEQVLDLITEWAV